MTFSTSALAASVAAAGTFDGADLASTPAAQLVEVKDVVARIRRMADALLMEVAGEIARRSTKDDGPHGVARSRGFASPGHLLADALGSSEAEAHRLLTVAQATQPSLAGDGGPGDASRGDGSAGDGSGAGGSAGDGSVSAGPRFPVIASTVRAGDLSIDIAAVLTRALDRIAEVAPVAVADLEARMVAKAATLSLADVRRMVAAHEAKHRPLDVKERDRAAFDNRYVQIKDEADGSVAIHARLDVSTAAPIVTALKAAVKKVMQSRRDGATRKGSAVLDYSEDDRTPGQIHADALSAFARHALGCEQVPTGITTTIVVRVDERDLRNGAGCASVDGIDSPIAVGTAQRMATDAELLPLITGASALPLGRGPQRRLFTEDQKHALLERDGGCSWCHAPPSYCEAHHIRWWKNGGTTTLDNGVMLCVSCHHRIHANGWDVAVRDGEVWFTPPSSVDPHRTPRIGGKAHFELGA